MGPIYFGPTLLVPQFVNPTSGRAYVGLVARANSCIVFFTKRIGTTAPQFDYLKNTVSVVYDYYKSFNNYKVTSEVFDVNSKRIFTAKPKRIFRNMVL